MRKGLLYGIIGQMKRHFRILVGAAVGLMLTPAPLPALSRDAQPHAAPLILAQAQSPEEEKLLRRKQRKGARRDEQPTPRAERPAQRERAERPAAREREAVKRRAAKPDAPAIAEERQKRRKVREAVKRRAVEPEPAITEERQKRRKVREAVKRRAAEPEPAITEERQKRRKVREAARQRNAEPDAPAIAKERLKRRKVREAVKRRAAEPEPAITEERLKRRKEREAAMRRPENAARLFDSAKEKPVRRKPGGTESDQPTRARAERPPESDAAAQARASTYPVQVGSVISEEGRRIERPRRERPEVPEG
ncbi:MAG: hypothetical protein E5W87_32185, partial [Mesorhizobium sp.]